MSLYIPIASQIVTNSVQSVTFNNIPTSVSGKNLRDLTLTIKANNPNSMVIYFNGNRSSYQASRIWAQNSSTFLDIDDRPDFLLDSFASSIHLPTMANMEIFEYAQTNKEKNCLISFVPGFSSGQALYTLTSGNWRNFSAITSITIESSDLRGEFSLYGVEA